MASLISLESLISVASLVLYCSYLVNMEKLEINIEEKDLDDILVCADYVYVDADQ